MTIQEMQQKKRELGITYEKLAELCGLAPITVQRIINGTTPNPRPYTKGLIEMAFINAESASGIVKEEAFQYSATGKKQGEYTAEDYFRLPDDQRCELIDGVIYDFASPTDRHQDLCGELFYQLMTYVKTNGGKCKPRMAPSDVHLDNKSVVQPDVYIRCVPKSKKASPEFAAEIISPSTRSRDYIIKLKKYMESGVREYWILDHDKDQISVYLFENGDFTLSQYSFSQAVPVAIWDGKCQVDFSGVLEDIAEASDTPEEEADPGEE